MEPSEICKERLGACIREHSRLSRKHRILGNARLAGAVVGLACLWFVETYLPSLTWYLVAALLGAFVLTTRAFSNVEEAVKYTLRAAILYLDPAFGYRRRVAPGQGALNLDNDKDQPYSLDVDILQADGLFDLLNLAATREGMRELAKLITNPADLPTIRQRQAAVRELKDRLDLREKFYVTGALKLTHIRTDGMLSWAGRENSMVPRWVPAGCLALSVAVAATGIAAALGSSIMLTASFAGALGAQMLYWRRIRAYLTGLSLESDKYHVDFAELLGLLRILEKEDFESPILREISDAFRADGMHASRALQKFCRIISLYEARRNQIVAMLGPLVLYETQLALAVERWRTEWGRHLPAWIQAIAKFEAYTSLACFAFEHPQYAFPALTESGPVLQAENLAHPLLGAKAVANDVALNAERPILVISGANMAGKSTYLRSIGISLALAYAGAPVRATSMTMSDISLIASIRVTDSLRDGESRFSAELKRLQMMLEQMRGGTPTLVLIDELFAGTNSYDRFSGAVSLGKHILGFSSVLAVLSTHDRNVTRWAEENADRISNAHFEDVFDEGGMTFDYKLRSGPATRGNAVELMRQAGLPIERTEAVLEA